MEENIQLILAAQKDLQAKDEYLKLNEETILRIASKTANRYLTKSDDEFSIGLLAFSKAIDTYDESKGSFNSYAGLLIQRNLIDYYRKENIYTSSEVSTAPEIIASKADEGAGGTYEMNPLTNNVLQEEIQRANVMLQAYGFRFFDLVTCSPKQEKTKNECAEAISYVLAHSELVSNLKASHQLPIKDIKRNTKISLKSLERYRRYIIMAVLILNEDYPYLANYLKHIERRSNI